MTDRRSTAFWLDLIRACRSMSEFKRVHAQLIAFGLHQNKDILSKSIVFSADPSVGDLDYAERISTTIRRPFLFAYNVLIKAFFGNRDLPKVLTFFAEIREAGLRPDNYTYPFVLKSIGRLKRESEAGKIHGHVTKTGLEFENYVSNSLLEMYSELGQTESANNLFERIPEKSIISWNVIISCLVRRGRYGDAINVFSRLRAEKNLKPVEATIVSTLSACAALKNEYLGREIHRRVRINEIPFTDRIGNSLLDFYAKCGRAELAREMFDSIRTKNVICLTSMITGYLNVNRLDEARNLFDGISDRDLVLWTAMINGYVRLGRFEEAFGLFGDMRSEGIKPDNYTFTALLTACAQTGALDRGRWIHGCIDENGIGAADTVVGTALIEMYAKCGRIEKSLEIFRDLEERDSASWTSIICGLAMNGESIKALELFDEMNSSGIKADCVTFVGVLSACSHGGLVELGQRVFRSMEEIFCFVPTMEHYACLIDLLGRAGYLDEAELLIESIPSGGSSDRIVAQFYGALLSACRIHGNSEIGERISKKLMAIDSSDSSVHSLLANIYSSMDRWDDVTKVRRNMMKLGVKKVAGCSSVEVNGAVAQFLAGDSSHPRMTDIASLLANIYSLAK